MLYVAAVAASVVGAAGAFPPGTEVALQKIADAKSVKYNCSISVAVYDGHTNLQAVGGIADFSSGRQATPSDKYVWGSGTKPLTGSSILKLISEGKFGLDDAVAPLVNPFLAKMADHNPKQTFRSLEDLWGKASDGNVSKQTVRQLLSMKAGIPDFDTAIEGAHKDALRAEYFADPTKFLSPTDLMSVPWVTGIWDPKILRENGGYSSTNFMVLGLILAANSGVSSWEEFNQASFMPESLRSKFEFGITGAPSKYTAVHGYDRTSYNMPVNQTNDQDVFNVDGVFGGWTAADLVAAPSAVAELYWAVYGPNPSIAPGSNVLMPSPFASGQGDGFYGIATFDLGDYTGHNSPKYGRAWGHLGATYGFDSIVAFFPAFNFVFAMSSNIENDDQTHPAETICYAYTAVANLMLGQNAKCKFSDGGYYSGGCVCDNFTAVETPAAVIV